MNEYELKDSPRIYVEPVVSYFEDIYHIGEKTVMALAATAGAVALKLLSCACTSIRGYANYQKD